MVLACKGTVVDKARKRPLSYVHLAAQQADAGCNDL